MQAGSARALACSGWRLANHNETPEVKAPFGGVGRATPTGEGADWQHARARALPICFWWRFLESMPPSLGVKGAGCDISGFFRFHEFEAGKKFKIFRHIPTYSDTT